MLPRVYADFNAIEYLDEGRTKAEMPLTGYGTLASLARQRLRLQEGMSLLLYEPDDIQCEAVAHYDPERKDPAGRIGEWVARFDPSRIRTSEENEAVLNGHPCVVCGQDFLAQTPVRAKSYRETCTTCGAHVMEPLAPPKVQPNPSGAA